MIVHVSKKNPELMLRNKFACRLLVSDSTIRRWESKKIGFPKSFTLKETGQKRFFNRATVEQWIEENVVFL